MSIVITGNDLTIDDVVRVARFGEKIELHSDALERMAACREMLERKLDEGQVIYGVNTGIGEMADVRLEPEQVEKFQKYLIISHSAGIGDPAPGEHVRAALLGRINVHAKGYSGCRPVVTETLVEMLNRGVTPVVCEKGSVGASGDLAAMSQATLVLIGMGEAFVEGERLPGADAMRRAGLEPIEMKVRDGLALINGSNLICGIGALEIYDAERWLKQAEIAAAMSLEALLANMQPYDDKIHELRGFRGARTSAYNLRKMIEGSDLLTSDKARLQDSYSMRSSPQVLGTARDQFEFARKQIETELNGVADNPIFITSEDRILSGANFQGTPISVPLESVGSNIAMVSLISERRLNRLLNAALSAGLPPFLCEDPGLHSGLMLSQYTADMLVVEQKILSSPAQVLSLPASADQEDFVSMGMNTALKTKQIYDNACGVIGIEMMTAARALDLRDIKTGKGTKAAYDAVRKIVPELDINRPLYDDHNHIKCAVERGDILEAVEKAIGELKNY